MNLTLIDSKSRIGRLGRFDAFHPQDRLIVREDIPSSLQETAVPQASSGCVLFGSSRQRTHGKLIGK